MSEQLSKTPSVIQEIAKFSEEHPRAVRYARDLALAKANVTALRLAGEIESDEEAQARISQVKRNICDKVDAEEPGFVKHYIAAREMMVADLNTDNSQELVDQALNFINELDEALAPERAAMTSMGSRR